MKKIKAILVDDEEPSRISLQKLLEWNAPDIELMELCSSVEKAITAIDKHEPDLVFLDIEMPVRNGFDLLQDIDQINFEIIFVTAYDQFAIQAFKQRAVGYLLKPVDEDELKEVLDRARKQIQAPVNAESLLDLYATIGELRPGFNKIAIPTMEGLELIKIDHILHCEGEGNYTRVYRTDEPPLLVSKSLKHFDEQLASHKQFVRVHNSHLVNLEYVKRYVKGKGGCLVLEDGSTIPVSRARKEDLLDNF